METRGKILVVDDETAIRDLLSNILEEEGFEVITAAHASLAAIRGQYVDCIILDLQLSPEHNMEGGNVLVHFWEDTNCKVPVIIFSGFLGTLDIEEALKKIETVCGKGRNIFRCVPKSIGVKPLIAAVNDCFAREHAALS
jgi:two-component system response regulator (stage 0 sporulation protein F)